MSKASLLSEPNSVTLARCSGCGRKHRLFELKPLGRMGLICMRCLGKLQHRQPKSADARA